MAIVMKFGGTSVANGDRIKRAAKLVTRAAQNNENNKVAVVVSAMSGVTDSLLEIAETSHKLTEEEIENKINKIKQKHIRAAKIAVSKSLEEVKKLINKRTKELKEAVKGIKLTGLTEKGKDSIASFGEKLSTIILSSSISDFTPSQWFYGDDNLVLTNNNFTSAEPKMDEIQKQVNEKIKTEMERGIIPVLTGFMGCTSDGFTTTLGRGSSDQIAAILGVCLNAKEIQIWTDVNGLMTADPKIVENSKIINKLSFKEASELAYFGAKVLHPKTILPAMEKDIPIKIKNTQNPKVEGTTIVREAKKHPDVIKAVTSKKNITLIDIVSTRMLAAHGFLVKLFKIFEKHKVSVDMISTTEVSVSLTVDDNQDNKLEPLIKELKKIANVKMFSNKALVCVVGEGMRHTPNMTGKVFSCLGENKINVECISQGASEISISFVVDNNNVNKAVKILHKKFFTDG